jgi:hypothetical protein
VKERRFFFEFINDGLDLAVPVVDAGLYVLGWSLGDEIRLHECLGCGNVSCGTRRAVTSSPRSCGECGEVVDRARLKTLPASALSGLLQSDELELVYAHLVSMRNFATVRDHIAGYPLRA